MITLYFTRLFTKGHLKGIVHHDSIRFVDYDHAIGWIKGINKKRNLGYRIVDKSFQNYIR